MKNESEEKKEKLEGEKYMKITLDRIKLIEEKERDLGERERRLMEVE